MDFTPLACLAYRQALPSWTLEAKGERRLADAISNAGRIATGEIDDLTTDDGKNAAAVALAGWAARREPLG
jgi:hypothetical protein